MKHYKATWEDSWGRYQVAILWAKSKAQAKRLIQQAHYLATCIKIEELQG